MLHAFALRSGSAKASGEDALFASARTISTGAFDDSALEPGRAPNRSAKEAEVQPGDVLVALRGPVNSAAAMRDKLPQPVFATLDLAVLRPHVQLDGGYLAWFINLSTTQTVLAGHRVSGGVPRLPLSALASLALPLPSLESQRRIAAVSDLAREEARLTTTLLRLRATILQTTLSTIASQAAQEATPCTP